MLLRGIIFLFFALGLFLADRFQAVDIPYRASQFFGMVLVFLSFVLSLYGWGYRMLEFLRVRITFAGEPILLGAVFKYLLGFALAHLGWIGESWRWLFLLLTAVGIFSLPDSELARWRNFFGLKRISEFFRPSQWGYLQLFALAILIGMQTLLLRDLEDVHIYHLFAAQRWWMNGVAAFEPDSTLMYLSGAWEYLQLWNVAYLIGPAAGGLANVQFFGQFLHGILAYVLLIMATLSLLRAFALSGSWRAVIAISVVTVESSLWTAFHAKNDFAAMVFVMLALLRVANREPVSGIKEDILAGIYLGMAIAIKVVSVLYTPFVLFFWFSLRQAQLALRGPGRPITSLLLAIMGAVVIFSPPLLRNFLETGSPLFPYKGLGFTHAYLTETLANIPIRMTHTPVSGIQWVSLGHSIFKVLTMELSIFPALIIALVIAIKSKQEIMRSFAWAFLIAAPLAILALVDRVGELHIVRFWGFLFALSRLMLLCGCYFLLELSSPRIRAWSAAIALLVGAMFLSRPMIPWSSLEYFLYYEPPHVIYQNKTQAGECLRYARENLLDKKLVILNYLPTFHVPAKKIITSYQSVAVDKILYNQTSFPDSLVAIHELGYDFIVDGYVQNHSARFYALSPQMTFFLHKHSFAHRFKGELCVIFDLAAFKAATRGPGSARD